jgi:hypothetical protein
VPITQGASTIKLKHGQPCGPEYYSMGLSSGCLQARWRISRTNLINERSRVQEIKTNDKRDRFDALDPIWINGILFGCQGHQFGPITAARATAKRCPTAAWKRNCDAIKYCSSTNLDADSFCTDLQRGRKGRTVNDAKEPISIST